MLEGWFSSVTRISSTTCWVATILLEHGVLSGLELELHLLGVTQRVQMGRHGLVHGGRPTPQNLQRLEGYEISTTRCLTEGLSITVRNLGRRKLARRLYSRGQGQYLQFGSLSKGSEAELDVNVGRASKVCGTRRCQERSTRTPPNGASNATGAVISGHVHKFSSASMVLLLMGKVQTDALEEDYKFRVDLSKGFNYP